MNDIEIGGTYYCPTGMGIRYTVTKTTKEIVTMDSANNKGHLIRTTDFINKYVKLA